MDQIYINLKKVFLTNLKSEKKPNFFLTPKIDCDRQFTSRYFSIKYNFSKINFIYKRKYIGLRQCFIYRNII